MQNSNIFIYLLAKFSLGRIDNLIVEAITTLKEPDGSNKTGIAMLYIEVCK